MGRINLGQGEPFIAPVEIPVPGFGVEKVKFTFRYRSRDQLDIFLKEVGDADNQMDDVELIQRCATGWELEDEFSEQNVRALVQKYIAAPREVFETYVRELTGARRKN